MWEIAAINYITTSALVLIIYSISEFIWISGPLYICLIMIYTHLYVGIDKSVSIRIMGELVNHPKKRLTWKELEELYPTKLMIKSRLDLLVEKEWLKKKNGNYKCLSKGKKLVKINLLVKKLFCLDTTG